ncbi:DNA-directed RNA polymerase III subunit Rpc5 [Irpex rosettiformis]|uniref:DNA-directed RNA polymerase III subunit Rpc5 n=1 Tax=Irpex rosettiformis TaxID=378272 RepID=A0ACB8UKS4_9APHY|nr:DNA-directed RNA polymerase III subunit Rpc5 [Irpex rosettiformis]
MNDAEDRLISVRPIVFSNKLSPHLHLHQFPLLTRPLQVPPSAAASGKRIQARLKQNNKRFEIHVPVDNRSEVWNAERSKELGAARLEDDKEKNQEPKQKYREGEEPRLSETRLKSEQIPQVGTYVVGVIRNGKLYLHPISETHQLRPTLTYMDTLTRRTKRRSGDDDDDSDDGPPPDPDDPAPPPRVVKKEKKPAAEAKEVQVSIRKRGDDKGLQLGSGLTAMRRELLMAIRAEEDEQWEDYLYYDREAEESRQALGVMMSQSEEELQCKTDITAMLTGIQGL